MSATIFTVSTVKSRAVDYSIFDHFWGATNKTCYFPRYATIAMSSNQSNDECILKRIYNPITAMEFSAMFTFHLDNAKR